MDDNIKIGCCYKTRDGSWLYVNAKRGDLFVCRDIIIDEDGYDEEISEKTEEEIKKIIEEAGICYRPYYHKRKGLYKVWDETKPQSEAIVLQ